MRAEFDRHIQNVRDECERTVLREREIGLEYRTDRDQWKAAAMDVLQTARTSTEVALAANSHG
jgi:hypothetical protein